MASEGGSEIERRRLERQASIRERRRHRWINALIVIAPVAFALVYALIIATPRYEAESRFFVQAGSGQQGGGGGPASLLTTGNMGGMLGGFVDGWAVADFLKSRDAMQQLDQRVGLRQYLVHAGVDPLNHLSEDSSNDALYRAYQAAVHVSFNALEQIDVLRVSAYSPDDAATLSRALIGLAEEFVSSMNKKGVADKLKVSEESVRLAEQKALAAREALTAWRTTHGNIDPTATVSMLLNLSSQLETELSSAQINLDKIRALGNKDHFMLKPAEMQVVALKKRIESVRRRLSGQGNTEAKQLKSYEALRNTQAFADSNLTLAQQSYQQAMTDALRLQRYLSIIAQPVPTDQPSSPRTAILLLQALALGFVLMFITRVGMALLRGCDMVENSVENPVQDSVDPAGAAAVNPAVAARRAQADATARLREVIKEILDADDPARDMAKLAPALADASDGWRDVRRLLVSPYMREGRLALAIAALEVLIAAYPQRADERRTLASLLGRTEQWERAIAEADAAGALAPESAAMHAARIQLRVQAGRVAEAADVARATLDIAHAEPGEAHFWMLAFSRNGDAADAAGIAAMLDPNQLPNERVATVAVRALMDDDRAEAAIQLGNAALDAGHDSAALRSSLGLSHLRRSTEDDRKVHALTHFEAGLRASPADVRLLTLYGETLLRAGRYKEAVAPLVQAIELAPDLEQTRALYARALRYTLQYDEAAEQMLKLLEKSPEKGMWQRSAIGALSQAGRKQEAEALFDKYVAARSEQLPETFQEAVRQMEARLDSAPIPQARLDWAWSLRGDKDIDRVEWERRVRWGHMMDHLLFDWLECREDSVEEAMQVLGELDTGERFFAPLLAAGRGVVVATAHVGPMYAGLMALELLGIPSRWLATAPSVAQSSYATALISTADQTEAQVAKACMRALNSGYVLCLAIDGAANPAAPRTIFEGQDVTYSSFASHLAHRLGVPSVFYAPRWENGQVAYTLEMLPAANPGEDADAYAERWQKAYFERLREHLAGPPEDLRASGGIWRHVKPADRSAQ